MESSLRRRLQGLPSASLMERLPGTGSGPGSSGGIMVHRGAAGAYASDDLSSSSSDEDAERFHLSNLFSPSWYLSVMWNWIHSATFASVFVILLIWASIFMYITFYFLYIPSLDLSRAIHLQFDSDCDQAHLQRSASSHNPHKCSLPHAVVPLSQYRSPTLFAKGQQYRIRVDMVIPDSPVNRDQGMFMVRLTLTDAQERKIITSSRPSMLTYRSLPVKLIHTFFSWPAYLTGLKRESEDMQVPLIEEYVDGTRPNHGPAATARVELVARDLQVYSSSLIIQAHLTGLRYYMVHWPILTALFGIATIFAFLSLVTICSINRVVRDDSADTEVIFADDLSSRAGSEADAADQQERQHQAPASATDVPTHDSVNADGSADKALGASSAKPTDQPDPEPDSTMTE